MSSEELSGAPHPTARIPNANSEIVMFFIVSPEMLSVVVCFEGVVASAVRVSSWSAHHCWMIGLIVDGRMASTRCPLLGGMPCYADLGLRVQWGITTSP